MNMQDISTVAAAAAVVAEVGDIEVVNEKSTIDSGSSKVSKQKQSKPRSRMGCTGCKKSKVKCDEKHPTCTRCAKRGTECIFPLRVSIERPLADDESDNNKDIMNYYGVVSKYSDIPLLEQTREYVTKPNNNKTIKFLRDLIKKVDDAPSTRDFDEIAKGKQYH